MKSQALKKFFGGSTKKIRILGASLALLFAVFGGVYYISVVSPNTARAFSGGGSGTADDPYQIATCQQLQDMSLSPSSSYVLTQDIDCNETIGWNGGAGFQMVNVEGGLDGRNFSVTGLYINRPNDYCVGIVCELHTGFIKNIRFLNGPATVGTIAINGGSNVGVVGGSAYEGTEISNVYSELNVQANGVAGGNVNLGGIVGINRGTISHAAVTGSVTLATTNPSADGRSVTIGGIVGSMDALTGAPSFLTDSFSTGNVSIGANDPNSFAGELECGGILGQASTRASIARTYATGRIDCDANNTARGGLIGNLYNGRNVANNSTVTDSFATGRIEGTKGKKGGLIGGLDRNNAEGYDFSTDYFDVTTSTQAECVGIVTSLCTGVNSDGSAPGYFTDNNAPVYTRWDQQAVWQFDGGLPTLKILPVPANPPTNVAVIKDGRTLKVSWTEPIIEPGSPNVISDYQIYYRKHDQSTDWLQYDDGISTTTHADLVGLNLPDTYDFRVKAINNALSGLYSSVLTFSTGGPEIAPQNIQNTRGSKSLTFTWSAVDTADSYQIRYRKTGTQDWIENGIIEYSNLTANIRSLQDTTAYEVQIRAINTLGEGPWSTTIATATDSIVVRTITNCQELQNMKNDLDGSYVLANNIDCTNFNENGNPAGFQPVGNGKLFFDGSLDGKNFTISNLTINDTVSNDGTEYQGAGIFGVVAGASIKDITISNSSVTGYATLAPSVDTDGNGLPDAPQVPIDVNNITLPTMENITTGGQKLLDGTQTISRWAVGSVAGVIGGTGTYSNIRVNNSVVSGAVSGGVFGTVIPLATFIELNGSTNTLGDEAASLTLDSITSNGAIYGFISGGLIGIAATKPNLASVDPGILKIQNSSSSASVDANIGGGLVGFGSSLGALSLLSSLGNGTTPSGGYDSLNYKSVIIKNSFATGNVSACQAPSEIRVAALGGLIGVGSGIKIESSSASGNVSACSANNLQDQFFGNVYGGAMGGLSGALIFSKISDSHASGSVTAIDDAPSDTDKYQTYVGISGGLSGILLNSVNNTDAETVSNSYATGDVSSESATGLLSINAGLVGLYLGNGVIQSSYATGNVRNTMQSGSVLGASISGGLVGTGIGIDGTYITNIVTNNYQNQSSPYTFARTSGLVINNSYAKGEVRNTKVGSGSLVTIAGGATGLLAGQVTLANSHALGNVVNINSSTLNLDTGATNDTIVDILRKNNIDLSIAGGLSGVTIGIDPTVIISGSPAGGSGLPDIIDVSKLPPAIRIESAYATGSVNGNIAGGLVGSGLLSLSINKSYATGDVQGAFAGGIAGSVDSATVALATKVIPYLVGVFNFNNPGSPFTDYVWLLSSPTVIYPFTSGITTTISNTYSTGNITGVRKLAEINRLKTTPTLPVINGTDVNTPSVIGGIVGVFSAAGGSIENSYSAGKMTMPAIDSPSKDRQPGTIKLPELPAIAGGIVGLDVALPQTMTNVEYEILIEKTCGPLDSNVIDPQCILNINANNLVKKAQTIRNVFSASQLIVSDDTVSAGYSGLTLSPLGTLAGDSIKDTDILKTPNNYFDRSKISLDRCSGPNGGAYDLANTVLKSTYIPDGQDQNTLPSTIPNEWKSTYIDPVLKKPECTAVNKNNSQPNYFINNKANAPLNSWNFTNLWYTQAKDYPKFVAGAVTVTPNTPAPVVPPVPSPPAEDVPTPTPTPTTTAKPSPILTSIIRNIAIKQNPVKSDIKQVRGLKTLLANVPIFIARSIPYTLILALLILASLYSWQALQAYSELRTFHKNIMRVLDTKEAVENYLAITTHYLNTPAAIMGGAVELLESLKKISAAQAKSLKQSIKKFADDAAQLLVANQVSGAQANNDELKLKQHQKNPLQAPGVWVPALIAFGLIALANALFIYADVFNTSPYRFAVEFGLFALSVGLVALAYRYRNFLEASKELARNQLKLEAQLYNKRTAFLPQATKVTTENSRALQLASAPLKSAPEAKLFFNGLAMLTGISTGLANLEKFADFNAKPPLFDISSFAKKAVANVSVQAKAKNLTINTEVDAGLVSRIQPEEIRQLVESLLDNAVKFSNDNGVVGLNIYRKFNKLVISVSDTGSGISEHKLPSLLKPFTRGTDSMQYNHEGLGLGLYSNKVIVDKLGGTIRIDSKVGKGTTVTVTVPSRHDAVAFAPVFINPDTTPA
ncbi:MAG: ATP-binding protein [Candidatus Saccharibacteria bacterium]|nr:ATP-binding protein [Candidatus Saccharibacteria bacterium]